MGGIAWLVMTPVSVPKAGPKSQHPVWPGLALTRREDRTMAKTRAERAGPALAAVRRWLWWEWVFPQTGDDSGLEKVPEP